MPSLASALALLPLLSAVAARTCPVLDTSIIAHEGDPVGKEVVTDDGITLYISLPTHKPRTPGPAVLYLTDVFGIQLAQNKLLADSFARAGYITVAPDMFFGSPAPGDINTPGFNTTAFLAAHGPNVTDPIIESTLAYMRDTMKVSRIGATGYCFGGRYAFRFADTDRGENAVNAAFAAHPSLLEDGEITAIAGPVSVAAAETDSLLTPTRRAQIEALLKATGKGYQMNLYGGTSHGFATRANISVPLQKFGKESAFLQAVGWFGAWL